MSVCLGNNGRKHMPYAVAAVKEESDTWCFIKEIWVGNGVVISRTLLSALCSPDILPLSGTQLACPYLRSLAFPLDYSSGRYESLLPPSALCPNRFLWLPYYICTLSSASMSILWFFSSGILFLLIYYIFYFLIFTFVSLCPECKHCDDSGFCLFTIFECLLHASITLHVIFPAYMECVLTLSLHVQCCITFNL